MEKPTIWSLSSEILYGRKATQEFGISKGGMIVEPLSKKRGAISQRIDAEFPDAVIENLTGIVVHNVRTVVLRESVYPNRIAIYPDGSGSGH